MKKTRNLIIILVAVFCFFLASCTAPTTKYVVNVEESEGKIVITYSDNTTSEFTPAKGETGNPGVAGPQGPAGEPGAKGEPGEAAKPIEFRYYRAQLWWRYVDTKQWFALVSQSELDQEPLEIEDFAMDVYSEEYDVSISVASSVKVNGSWVSTDIQGNTLVVLYEHDEKTTYFDITVDSEANVTILTYEEAGVDEKEVAVVDNAPLADFIGTYTLKGENSSEFVVEVNSYGNVSLKEGEETYSLSSYGKGNVLFAKQSYGGSRTVAISKEESGLSFKTSLPNAEDVYEEYAQYTYTKWVDVTNFYGIYTLYTDEAETFDFAVKAYNSLSLFDDTYPRYTYSVDTLKFTVNEVNYSFQYVDGNIVPSSDAEGAITIKKWSDVVSTLKKFVTVDSENNKSTWTVSEYGSVNLDDEYFGNATQRKNVVTLAPYGNTKSLAVTYNEQTGTYSAVYTEGDLVKELTVVMDATVEDFLGSYSIKYNLSPEFQVSQSFSVAKNPYAEGYAFILADNPNAFTLSGRTLTYTNQRAGTGYQITANYDGTKSVVYFTVLDNLQPDPSSFIDCIVVFNAE